MKTNKTNNETEGVETNLYFYHYFFVCRIAVTNIQRKTHILPSPGAHQNFLKGTVFQSFISSIFPTLRPFIIELAALVWKFSPPWKAWVASLP